MREDTLLFHCFFIVLLAHSVSFCMSCCIVGKFGQDLNLAIWQVV